MQARLQSPTDIVGFRTEARQLLANQVPPDAVTWSMPVDPLSASAESKVPQRPRDVARAASSIVPASFVRLCDYVVQHRDPERFALLYRLLWRLVHEPQLRHDAADPDMIRAQHMAHAVRRDIHKLKTQVRLREIADPDRPDSPLQVAWCDPAHNIIESAAHGLSRKLGTVRCILFSPELSAYWNSPDLRIAPGSTPMLTQAMPDSEWLGRWHKLFD